MFNILVFAGTTEGRELAEFCVAEQIPASFSVTTDYGAALLPQSEFLTILQGKLDCIQMQQLFSQNRYNLVIDATHPYAVEATKTIRSACALTQTPYYRLLREESTHTLPGTVVDSMEDLIAYVNQDNRILFSTMGSKELPALTRGARVSRTCTGRDSCPFRKAKPYAQSGGLTRRKVSGDEVRSPLEEENQRHAPSQRRSSAYYQRNRFGGRLCRKSGSRRTMRCGTHYDKTTDRKRD